MSDELAQSPVSSSAKVAAVILAGGQATRMAGRDKPLCLLSGKPLLQHVLDRIEGLVGDIVISANGDTGRFDHFSLPVVGDLPLSVKSPLLGVLSAMDYFARQPEPPACLLCVPADVPLFPVAALEDLLGEVMNTNTELGYLRVNGQPQPLFAVISLSLLAPLRAELERGRYGVQFVFNDLGARILDIASDDALAFANINTPEQLQVQQDSILRPDAAD